MSEAIDLLVIGAGPGGYVAAIRAAQLGMKVVVVDKRSLPGGTCLNVGCIPSKALLHSSHKYIETKNNLENHGIEVEKVRLNLKKMQGHKENVVDELTRGIHFLFNKNKITFIHGTAQIKGRGKVQVITASGDEQDWEPRHILIATGSEPLVPAGMEVDEEFVVTSTGALSLSKVPKHLVVIGAGYIGLELGSVWARLGAAVTVVEALDHPLLTLDQELASALHKSLSNQGLIFRFGHKVAKIMKREKDVALHIHPSTVENLEEPEIMTCDVVLLAIGRRPHTEGLGLINVGINVDDRGFIPVNRPTYETVCPGVYAIGDVTPGPMLAHKAEEEGIAVVERIAGQAGHVNYDVIPSVVYTSPEAAMVGKTEEELKKEGIAYNVGKFPFLANARAKAVGDTAGFVKVLSDEKTDRILGVHIIGAEAGTMIAEAALAMEMVASAEDLARTCHAHPTHSEALKEAAMAAYGKAIHI
ncbi:MAG: dihydrolipoyl dehydrogenase [Alphaproteobacteria bacterium]|jgi:dihydrolipoamide dehydrogenase|nr:dihydrolipoyl dehydrogenase [Alphaproteobacteria bacterium]